MHFVNGKQYFVRALKNILSVHAYTMETVICFIPSIVRLLLQQLFIYFFLFSRLI